MIPVFEKSLEFYQWLESKRISFEEDDENVKQILNDVRQDKDEAVRKYTLKYDQIDIPNLKITPDEMDEALNQVDDKVLDMLKRAKDNIYEYHLHQKTVNWSFSKPGKFLGQVVNPIEKVGLYVPGGLGLYPSSVLMTAIPAKIAGVPEIYMITPPAKSGKINPIVLAAASICEINGIFKVGGVQGVAALSYGTPQIPKVYKVVGPGNKYVTLAKKYLYGTIDIDSLAGPSEVLIFADEETSIPYLVADVFAQAEHSEDAQAIVLLPNEKKAKELNDAIEIELKKSKRKNILKESVVNNSAIYIYNHFDDAFEVMNEYAAEHLEVLTKKISYDEIIQNIKNAGAIFIGDYSPVPLGDYYAVPNHTLPTNGTAKYASPLGVYDFVKYTSIIKYDKKSLLSERDYMAPIAELEGFFEHANSLKVRK